MKLYISSQPQYATFENYQKQFGNGSSITLLNLSQWQYWFWFWFALLWTLYIMIIIRIISKKTQHFNITVNTSLKSHGKWGDFLIAVIPATWCVGILINSNFIMRQIEWQIEGSLFNVHIQGKQWYWVYKYDADLVNKLNNSHIILGHGKIRYMSKFNNESWKLINRTLTLFLDKEFMQIHKKKILKWHNDFKNKHSEELNNIIVQNKLKKLNYICNKMFKNKYKKNFNYYNNYKNFNINIMFKNIMFKNIFLKNYTFLKNKNNNKLLKKLCKVDSIPVYSAHIDSNYTKIENVLYKLKEAAVFKEKLEKKLDKIHYDSYHRILKNKELENIKTIQKLYEDASSNSNIKQNFAKDYVKLSKILITHNDILKLTEIKNISKKTIQYLQKFNIDKLLTKDAYYNTSLDYKTREEYFEQIQKICNEATLLNKFTKRKIILNKNKIFKYLSKKITAPYINNKNTLKSKYSIVLKYIKFHAKEKKLQKIKKTILNSNNMPTFFNETKFIEKIIKTEKIVQTDKTLQFQEILKFEKRFQKKEKKEINMFKILAAKNGVVLTKEKMKTIWKEINKQTGKQSTLSKDSFVFFNKKETAKLQKKEIKEINMFKILAAKNDVVLTKEKMKTLWKEVNKQTREHSILLKDSFIFFNKKKSLEETAKFEKIIKSKEVKKILNSWTNITLKILNHVKIVNKSYKDEWKLILKNIFIGNNIQVRNTVNKKKEQIFLNKNYYAENLFVMNIRTTIMNSFMTNDTFYRNFNPMCPDNKCTIYALKAWKKKNINLFNIGSGWDQYSQSDFFFKHKESVIEPFIKQSIMDLFFSNEFYALLTKHQTPKFKIKLYKNPLNIYYQKNIFVTLAKKQILKKKYEVTSIDNTDDDTVNLRVKHVNTFLKLIKGRLNNVNVALLKKNNILKKNILFNVLFNKNHMESKISEPENYWGFRQKKLRKIKIYNSQQIQKYDPETLKILKNNNIKIKTTNKYIKTTQKIYKYNFYKNMEQSRHRTELIPENLALRLLRTKRTLVLPTNTNITLITNSYDVIHSWFIPSLGLKLDCVPGRSTHHTFRIERPGFYYGQCAEICGRYHHHMPIRVCAIPFPVFVNWWQTKGMPRVYRNKKLKEKTELMKKFD